MFLVIYAYIIEVTKMKRDDKVTFGWWLLSNKEEVWVREGYSGLEPYRKHFISEAE